MESLKYKSEKIGYKTKYQQMVENVEMMTMVVTELKNENKLLNNKLDKLLNEVSDLKETPKHTPKIKI